MVPSRLRDPDRARSREDLCKTPKSRPAENETEQTRRASSLNKIACYLLQRYLVAIRVPAPCLKTRIIPTLRLKTRIAPPLYGLPYARATHDAWYTCTAAIDARNGRGAHTHRCMPQPLIQISQGRQKSSPITSAQKHGTARQQHAAP